MKIVIGVDIKLLLHLIQTQCSLNGYFTTLERNLSQYLRSPISLILTIFYIDHFELSQDDDPIQKNIEAIKTNIDHYKHLISEIILYILQTDCLTSKPIMRALNESLNLKNIKELITEINATLYFSTQSSQPINKFAPSFNTAPTWHYTAINHSTSISSIFSLPHTKIPFLLIINYDDTLKSTTSTNCFNTQLLSLYFKLLESDYKKQKHNVKLITNATDPRSILKTIIQIIDQPDHLASIGYDEYSTDPTTETPDHTLSYVGNLIKGSTCSNKIKNILHSLLSTSRALLHSSGGERNIFQDLAKYASVKPQVIFTNDFLRLRLTNQRPTDYTKKIWLQHHLSQSINSKILSCYVIDNCRSVCKSIKQLESQFNHCDIIPFKVSHQHSYEKIQSLACAISKEQPPHERTILTSTLPSIHK